MVDKVHTQNMWTGHFVLSYYSFFCMIEASKVDPSASYVVGRWWLLAAVFVSAASTPHLGVFEAGGTLSEHPPPIRKYAFEVYVQN